MKRLISALLIPLAAILILATAAPDLAAQGSSRKELLKEYTAKRKKTDRKDVEAQYELACWCLRNGLDKRAKRHLKIVIKLEPDHSDAHKKLGHVYDAKAKKWLTERDLKKKKTESKDKEMAKKGMARWKGKWMPKEDVERLKAGMVKIGDEWYTKKDAEMIKRGYVRHPETHDWIKKEDLPKAQQGLFPVGDKWVPLAEANEYHSKWANRWQVVTQHYQIHTNMNWAMVKDLKNRVELVYTRLKDMAGGVEPFPGGQRLNVYVFGTQSDYNTYGGTCGTGYSSVMGGWFSIGDPEHTNLNGKPAVCYWDKNFGRIFLPHALAYQYMYCTFLVRGGFNKLERATGDQVGIPKWIIPGVACYCDRFWDRTLRGWACNMILKNGGLGSFSKGWFKGFGIAADFARASEQNIRNAGFLVCYIKHSGDAKAMELWKDIFSAMGEGEKAATLSKKMGKLQAHLVKNKGKIKEFFQKVQTGG